MAIFDGKAKARNILLAAAIILLAASSCREIKSSASGKVIPLMSALPANLALASQVVPSAGICENSAFVKDITIKDGTKIKPETPFVKKWEIMNTGTCGWNKRYSLQFFSGDLMSGETVYLKKWIPPGGTTVVSVNMIAPETEGKFEGKWILANAEGTAFGSLFTVKITVKKKIP